MSLVKRVSYLNTTLLQKLASTKKEKKTFLYFLFIYIFNDNTSLPLLPTLSPVSTL